MDTADRIFLRDHVLSAEIGAFQSERGRDQRLRFNLTVDLRDPVSGAEDHVDEILSYDVLTQAVTTALADQRYNLVETLAEKIAAEVLAHPRAARIEVSVEKLDRGPGALGVRILRVRSHAPVTETTPAAIIRLHAGGLAAPQGATVVIPEVPDLPLPQGGDMRRIRLLALDQSAWALAGQLGLEVAASRTELDAAIRLHQPVIWAPARLAFDAAEAGEDPRSLGFWLAARLDAQRIELVPAKGEDLPAAPDGVTVTIALPETS